MTYFYFTGTHVVTYNNIVSIQHPLKTNFKAFVKANDFFNIIQRVSSEKIVTKLENGKLKLKAGKVNATLQTINDEEVTTRIEGISKQASGLKWLRLPENFSDAVSMCKFATSKNESDQTLTCVKLDGTSCIAADNKRAAFAKLAKPVKPMLLKATEVKALFDINPTGYALNKSWLFFRNKTGCTFAIRRVQGNYPDFLSLFDFEGNTVEIPEEILEGVDIASIFTDDDTEKINVSVSNGMCKISVQSDAGQMEYSNPITYKGDSFEFSIAPDFLEEMMKHSTEITIHESRAKITSGDFMMVISLYG